jgi:ribose transport system substrate-binding protein
MARRFISLAVALVVLSATIACDRDKGNATTNAAGGAAGTKPSANNLTIGVVPKGLTHVFWRSVKAGAQRACDEEGATLKWDGPATEGERNTQTRIIDDLRNFGVDALVVAPLDEKAITPFLEQARKTMPVVVFDSGSTFKDYDAYVATDNRKGGQLAGQHMLKLIGDAKNVELAVIKYAAGSESTKLREAGFMDELKRNPNVTMYDQFAGEDANKAQTLTSNMLAAHPNISAMFASNESTTDGALGALEQAKRLGQVKFVGFDSSPKLVAALERNNINALVLQDPVRMGYLSVKAAVAAVRKQKVEKEQPIAPTLATQENMKQPDIQKLLRPKLD